MTHRRPKGSKIRLDEFIELFYRKKLANRDIARYFNVTESAIGSFRHRYKLPPRGWSKSPMLGKRHSQATRELISAKRVGKMMKADNHCWHGGVYIGSHGYRFVYSDSRREEGKYPYIEEHRQVIEQALGRKLESTEIVHHINEDKLDNRVENLMIVSRSEHARIHSPRGSFFGIR